MENFGQSLFTGTGGISTPLPINYQKLLQIAENSDLIFSVIRSDSIRNFEIKLALDGKSSIVWSAVEMVENSCGKFQSSDKEANSSTEKVAVPDPFEQ